MHSHILQNAPRQRIRLTANAKEIEAMQSAKVGGRFNASTVVLTRHDIVWESIILFDSTCNA